MPFTGGYTGVYQFVRRTAPAHLHRHVVVYVRNGGMRRYMARSYHVLAADEHRLTRLLQTVRADMAKTDRRVNTGALVLVDGVTGRPLASAAALDRLVGAALPNAPITLGYTVDTSRAPLAPVQLPPVVPVQTAVPSVPTKTPMARFDEMRRAVAAQLGAQLARSSAAGAPSATAVHNAAIEALRDHRDTLCSFGLPMPSRTINSIAADLAVSVAELNPTVITAANAQRVFGTTVDKSPAWNAIRCHLERRAPAAAAADENEALYDLEDAPALVVSSAIGATLGAPVTVRLPVARLSSAMPAVGAVHTIAPLRAAKPVAASASALERVGFRAHTAADYTVELVGAACNDCQAIGHRYRCGRRCRRNLRRLEEKRLFDKLNPPPAATPAVPAKPIASGAVEFAPLAPAASVSNDIQFVPLAKPAPVGDDIQFVPLTAAHVAAHLADIGCNTCGGKKKDKKKAKGKKAASGKVGVEFVPLAQVGCNTCGGGGAKPADEASYDSDDDIGVEFAPLAPTGVEFAPLEGARSVGAEATAKLDLTQPQPARVVAEAPRGYRVWLRDGPALTAVPAGGVDIRGGLRHVELENPAGARRMAQAEPLLFLRGQTSTIRLGTDANGSIKWSCSNTASVGAQLAAAFPAVAATPVPAGHMLLLHTDGRATTAPAGTWAAANNAEHEARAANGRSYFFDGSRCLVADGDSVMHNVLAAVPHPTAAGATVVLLPPLTAPRSD